MPNPPHPHLGEGFDRLPWLPTMIRSDAPTRLRRRVRRAWSRVLMAICLAEARSHSASFRVRPPPPTWGHQIVAPGAGPTGGAANPFAGLAESVGLPSDPTGTIAPRPDSLGAHRPLTRGGRERSVVPGRRRLCRHLRPRPIVGPPPFAVSSWLPPDPSKSAGQEHDLGEALILAAGLAGAGLGGMLLGGFGACLGLLIGFLVGGSYVERSCQDRW